MRRRKYIACCAALVSAIIAIVTLLTGGSAGGTPRYAYAFPVQATTTAVVSTDATPGTLSLANGAPSAVTPITLTNSDQAETYTIDLTVSDNTGSGSGWNLTVSMNQFTNGAHTLATSATSITGAASVCTGGTCTLPTSSISYPLATPAGTGAVQGTATNFYNAALNTGMGGIVVTPTFSTTIPANAFAGTYTSTFVFDLSSGP